MVWLTAPNLSSRHGFSTREGGVSTGPFSGLNLSENVGDDTAAVLENRRVALEALGVPRVARLRQVHSADVVRAAPGEVLTGDALVTGEAGVGLVIETADCYPVLLEDAEAGVIGAAHAGWRGTVAGVVGNALGAMVALGARPERVRAAIGPGICGERYAVGAEVLDAFRDAGFPDAVRLDPPAEGGAAGRVDLGLANAWLLERAGVPRASIWRAGACSTDARFFSYRRDAGRTGRMWAVIARPWEAA